MCFLNQLSGKNQAVWIILCTSFDHPMFGLSNNLHEKLGSTQFDEKIMQLIYYTIQINLIIKQWFAMCVMS